QLPPTKIKNASKKLQNPTKSTNHKYFQLATQVATTSSGHARRIPILGSQHLCPSSTVGALSPPSFLLCFPAALNTPYTHDTADGHTFLTSFFFVSSFFC